MAKAEVTIRLADLDEVKDALRRAGDRIRELEAIVTDLAKADPEQIPRTQLYLLRDRAREAGVVATGDNDGD